MLVIKELNIKCAEIYLFDSGIILLKYKSDYEIELKDVKEVEKVFLELIDEKGIFCLMDTSDRYYNITKEAQEFLSNEASIVKDKKIKGSAVVINNLPNRLLAQFFSKFFKPKFPMKIFSTQEEGMVWLKELIKKSSVSV